MAAGAWKAFKEAKLNLGAAGIDLSGIVRCGLLTSAALLSAGIASSTYASINANEVTSGNGYSSSGKTFSANTWALSGNNGKFDATAVFFSANGGAINNIKFAVVFTSGGKLICFSTLSTSQFNLSAGSRLTITPAATGIFTLS